MKIGFATFFCLLSLAASNLAMAQAGDRWLAEEDTASAALPAPRGADRITAATLSCEAQRWTLQLALVEGTEVAAGAAVLNVDGRAFDLEMVADGANLATVLPREALEPLRVGVRMTLDFTGALERALGDPVFALRGSRVAIDAVAARCTLRDMGDYTPVTFTPYSSYMNVAIELRKADFDAFAIATASQPRLDVAMAEFGGDRRVLFTRLCGSSWYFGSSGCNITGFAPKEGEPGWRAVYDTENVHLYTDPRSKVDGWPDIATLPVGSEGFPRLWRWNGSGYDFAGELPEASEPLALRPSAD